jgi:hypothetical protein
VSDFDFDWHRTTGTGDEARRWVEASALPAEQQAQLRGFIDRFPELTFVREDDALLDRLAADDGVTLPPWFRAVRTVLAGPQPGARLRFDDFEQLTPTSDDIDEIWYDLLPGYSDPEQRELFRDQARAYPIGAWRETGESYLAIGLGDPADERIVEFAAEDLLDSVLDGRSATTSVYPIFSSYPAMLSHVVAVLLPDGRVVHTR